MKRKDPLGRFIIDKEFVDSLPREMIEDKFMGKSVLEGKVIKNISIDDVSYPVEGFSYSFTMDAAPYINTDLFNTMLYGSSKKTLVVTKKEDIKFV